MIEHIRISNFTVFDNLDSDLVPGVNIFIGDNGTGKTHVLKLLYALQAGAFTGVRPRTSENKLLKIFLPHGLQLKRLIQRGKGVKKEASGSILKNGQKISWVLTSKKMAINGGGDYMGADRPVYIPVKEMLANAPGFRSLYRERETHFEEIYSDILDKAFLPPLKKMRQDQQKLLKILKKEIGGKIHAKNEVFFLRKRSGDIEFSLVAEGIRKLALLWLLVRNGSLDKGATLYWDEPETNLNPSMTPVIVKTLLALERMGVQIFIATHGYALLKEFDLQRTDHSLCYYTLYKAENNTISLKKETVYHKLEPNKIAEQYSRIYDLEIQRTIGGL